MGRHSDGQRNFTISPVVYVIVACVVAALIAGYFWVNAINDDSETAAESECLQGALELPVVAAKGDEAITRKLIDDYNASNPVVRDYCVTAVLSDSLAAAGAYVTTESDGKINAVLGTAQRSPATLEWPTAAALQVGVAATSDVNVDSLKDVTYPIADNAVASALVAANVTDNSVDDIENILTTNKDTSIDSAVSQKKSPIVTHENQVPDNYTFTAVKDLMQPVRVVALNATATVNEDLIRAGADFGTAVENTDAAKSTTSVAAVAAFEALHVVDASAGTDAQASEENRNASALDTLFLLDTSDRMGTDSGNGMTWFTAASEAIAETAVNLGSQGHAVALWNYSSPLNPGVQRGWRSNINFDDGTAGNGTAQAVRAFGTGGIPQTRTSTSAALNYAARHAQDTDKPIRIILVSSGTADQSSGVEIQSTARQAESAGVELDIIYLGAQSEDPELSDVAHTVVTVSTADEVAGAIEKLTGLN